MEINAVIKFLQLVYILVAFVIQSLKIYDTDNCCYDSSALQYAYSVDGTCWSCYMSIDDMNNKIDKIKAELELIVKKVDAIDEKI